MSKTKIISISGVTSGGKTTTVNELLNKLPNSKALFFDDRDYAAISGITDLGEWERNGWDMSQWNLQDLIDDIELLLEENLDYIILDYPFGYMQNEISGYVSLVAFIDTPLDIAMARRMLRDFRNSLTSDIMDDMEWYLDEGRELFISSNEIQSEDADLIIDGSLPVNERCDEIINAINLL